MNYTKDIFKLLGVKPNQIFKTDECDEFVYKLDENLQGYYFNLEEGDMGFAHIETDWRTDPILLANLLTDKTRILEMTSQDKILIKKLRAMPKIEEKKENDCPYEFDEGDDFWAQLNKAILQEAVNQYDKGDHATAELLSSYISPKFR